MFFRNHCSISEVRESGWPDRDQHRQAFVEKYIYYLNTLTADPELKEYEQAVEMDAPRKCKR